MYFIIFHHQYKVLAKSPLLPLGYFYIVTSLHILLWIPFSSIITIISLSLSLFLFFIFIFFGQNERGILGFPGGSETQEMQVWCLGQKDPLEWEIVTHSNILAWEILWTEESGELQSTEPLWRGHFNVPVIVILYYIPYVHSLIISICSICTYVIWSIQKSEYLRFGVISCDC